MSTTATRGTSQPTTHPEKPRRWVFGVAVLGLLALATVSLFVGVNDLSPADFMYGRASEAARQTLFASRVPRTVAVLLAGSSLAMAGLLMQLLVRNRFVEPGTVGTAESAGAGILLATMLWPGSPLSVKMLIAVVTALAGTALFMKLVNALPRGESVIAVPLVGMMLSGMISATTTAVAYRFDLIQTLGVWMAGDFSGILRGRYELLWLIAGVFIAVWFAADQFTIASLGEEQASNLGLNYRAAMNLGLAMIAISSAVCLVVVGNIGFVGLVVPNLVSAVMGDNLRRSLGWVALCGAAFVLVCDLLARTINYPYEIPVSTIAGVIGAVMFLTLLLRRMPTRAGGQR
ncbi:ABC transporter permease [Gephyromycinifex aptenodytis]|uniref:ABC transporter permease n=1 Tax=Gephyromycinifex aptenodytis TaxID=2716227 RepID=UPI001D02C4C1|nr:iron chelate uptake ABC transporter family permease subunit [Gephyromycinifex aptenodytis]